jgi:hypothetical protein
MAQQIFAWTWSQPRNLGVREDFAISVLYLMTVVTTITERIQCATNEWNKLLFFNVFISNDKNCLVFGSSWVQISAWRLAILTEVFVVFLSLFRHLPA